MEFAICERCFMPTLSPKLSLDGKKTLCPDCAELEMSEEEARRSKESEE
jgi:hypothetical protein